MRQQIEVTRGTWVALDATDEVLSLISPFGTRIVRSDGFSVCLYDEDPDGVRRRVAAALEEHDSAIYHHEE